MRHLLDFWVRGAEFHPDEFLGKHSLEYGILWMRGTPKFPGTKNPRLAGKTHTDSGFTINLPDTALPEMGSVINEFVRVNSSWLALLQTLPCTSYLHIGLFCGTSECFVPMVELDKGVLQMLASYHIDLHVSAFPTSDDDDDDDDDSD